MEHRKLCYNGLLTQRIVITGQTLMASSNVHIKVKTKELSNTGWQSAEEETLSSEIMSSSLE